MEPQETFDRKDYIDQWILICDGKVIAHNDKLEAILGSKKPKNGECHIEKVVEGQACYY